MQGDSSRTKQVLDALALEDLAPERREKKHRGGEERGEAAQLKISPKWARAQRSQVLSPTSSKEEDLLISGYRLTQQTSEDRLSDH